MIIRNFRSIGMGLCAAIAVIVLHTGTAAAAFDANRLMDDNLFDDKNSMNAAQIDSFLNAHGSCLSTNSGFSAPDPIGYSPSAGFKYGGNVSAGTVIYDSAQAYDLNPKVLIATLQKEQSLITSTSCSTNTISKAVGYACPDGGSSYSYSGVNLYTRNGVTYTSVSGICVNSAAKAGFTQQLIRAAWLLKFSQQRSLGHISWAIIRGNWDNSDDLEVCYKGPVTKGWRQVCPSGSTTYYDGQRIIDGTTVTLTTGASAALYWYTPHFSGNRNFVNIYESWFGSTQAINGDIIMARGLRVEPTGDLYEGETVTGSYQVTNNASIAIDAGGLGVCARMNNQWYDFGYVSHNTIAAGATITVSFNKTLDRSGNLEVFLCSYLPELGGWAGGSYPYGSTATRSLKFSVKDNPLITTGLTLSPSAPAAGEPVTASFVMQNNGPADVNIGRIFVAARDPSGNNVDFPSVSNVVVPANGTYTYTQSRSMVAGGNYSLFVANFRNNKWDMNYPKTASSGIARKISVSFKDNPLMTGNLTLSPANPSAGQNVTATFTLTNSTSTPVNVGRMLVAGRTPTGANVDFPSATDVIVPANGTYMYSQSRTMPSTGRYSFFVANNRAGLWDMNYPKSASGVSRTTSATVQSNPLITTNVSLSTASPRVGQAVTATYTITNATSSPVNIGRMLLAGRTPSGANEDLESVSNVTVPANGTFVYSKTITFMQSGKHHLFVANNRDGVWDMNYPQSAIGISRDLYVDVTT